MLGELCFDVIQRDRSNNKNGHRRGRMRIPCLLCEKKCGCLAVPWGARPPAGVVGCAPAHYAVGSHWPSAAFFPTAFRGRELKKHEGGHAPRDLQWLVSTSAAVAQDHLAPYIKGIFEALARPSRRVGRRIPGDAG
jgi:hypothetical protein